MAENLGGRFATMSEDERRRFAMEQGRTDDLEEIAFDDPRKDHATTKANLADHDGEAALVDEEQHARRVQEEAERQKQRGRGE